MLKQLFDYVHRLLLLAHETKRNRDDLEELRGDFRAYRRAWEVDGVTCNAEHASGESFMQPGLSIQFFLNLLRKQFASKFSGSDCVLKNLTHLRF